MRRELRLLAATLSTLAIFVTIAFRTVPAIGQVMSVPGKFDVDINGAATYSIPIAVPSGTAGMTPALALKYNSQQGSGFLGIGWALSGLPSINRCPKTTVQDSVRGVVNYDAEDRFCLDGQRLIAISGAYGADGTEYRTEIESFARIISRGSADATNGQIYPNRIDYTANDGAGLSAHNSVLCVRHGPSERGAVLSWRFCAEDDGAPHQRADLQRCGDGWRPPSCL